MPCLVLLAALKVITAFDAHHGIRRTVLVAVGARMDAEAIRRFGILFGRDEFAALQTLDRVWRKSRVDSLFMEAVGAFNRSIHASPRAFTAIEWLRIVPNCNHESAKKALSE